MSWRTLPCLALLLIPTARTEAQGFKRLLDNLGGAPEVQVTLQHPARLGLDVSRIAFGPEEGECAGEFVDALIADFTDNGVEVVNRRQIEALLAEHEFSLSGLVNRSDAVELGKILGPAALVFVSVRRCTTERQSLTNSKPNFLTGTSSYEYVSRTTGYFRGSLQVVDLATARIHTARSIQKQISVENRSTQGRPEFPSQFTLLDAVLREAGSEVHRWFFSWSEVRRLKFFDAKACNLRLAYNLVVAGDLSAAREQSVDNLEICEVNRTNKPKLFARALYNFAMTEFLLGNYDAALEYFDESLRVYALDPTPEAIADCRSAKESALALEAELAEADLADSVPTGTGLEQASNGGTPAADEELTLEERLQRLEELYKKGLISKEVYEQKQADLLEEL